MVLEHRDIDVDVDEGDDVGDDGVRTFENINLCTKLNVHSFDILTVDSFVFFYSHSLALVKRSGHSVPRRTDTARLQISSQSQSLLSAVAVPR